MELDGRTVSGFVVLFLQSLKTLVVCFLGNLYVSLGTARDVVLAVALNELQSLFCHGSSLPEDTHRCSVEGPQTHEDGGRMARKLRVTQVDSANTNVSYRRYLYSCHSVPSVERWGEPQTPTPAMWSDMLRYTDKPWWSVEEAARLLRVNVHTLYRAIARDDFPHQRIGVYIKIPAQALLLTPLPDPVAMRIVPGHLDLEQLELPLDPPPVPVRRYRDGTLKTAWDYERKLWRLPN